MALLGACDLFQPLQILEESEPKTSQTAQSEGDAAKASHAAGGEVSGGAESEAPLPPEALLKSERGGGTVDEGVSGAQLQAWLAAHVAADQRKTPARARLETVSEGARWRVVFPDRLLAPNEAVEVQVVRHKAMTVMAAPLLVLPQSVPPELLGSLLVQNFDLYQSKLALGPGNRLFISYEVPNRLLDERELGENLEDLSFLAQKLTGLLEQRLIETALGGSRAGTNPGGAAGMAPQNPVFLDDPPQNGAELGPGAALGGNPPWPVPGEEGVELE